MVRNQLIYQPRSGLNKEGLLSAGRRIAFLGKSLEDINRIIKFIDNEISGKLCPEINYDET